MRHEAETIRETELDRLGGFEIGRLETADENWEASIFVDRLGRVVLPGESKYENISSVSLGGKTHKVTRVEPRYQGTRLAAWVYYLEKE